MFWAYVPHFVHSPFYVYAYAFGDCLVNALYSVFQDGHPGFAGQVSRHAEGRRARKPSSRAAGAVRARCRRIRRSGSRGLDVISGFIDELEADVTPGFAKAATAWLTAPGAPTAIPIAARCSGR